MTLDEAIKYYKVFNGTLILVEDESKQIVILGSIGGGTNEIN